MLRCPNPECDGKRFSKVGNRAKVRIDHPIEIDENGDCFAKCYWCKKMVKVPLRLAEGVEIPGEKFVLGKTGRGNA